MSWEHNRLYGTSNLKVDCDGIRIARLGTAQVAGPEAPVEPSFPRAMAQRAV